MKKILLWVLALFMFSNLYATKVTAIKPSITEERFQLYIAVELVKKLGYDVKITNALGYDEAYKNIASNYKSKDVYFMTSNWDPIHNNKVKNAGGSKKIIKFGKYIPNSAQGYLIDKRTANQYNIKYINDLKKPKIAKLFDTNGDGKADLAGCATGWGCEAVIEHQLSAFGLRKTISHNQDEYSVIISETISRYKNGQPILYYTWTPYWISNKLKPGKDVVFLQVTHSEHPVLKSTKLSNGDDYGFAVNSQRIVANVSTKKHKDISKLFELMELNVNDVSKENILVSKGEDTDKDIKRHAKSWIKDNQSMVNKWIKTAKLAK